MKYLRVFAVLGIVGLAGCSDSLEPGRPELVAPSFWQLVEIETDAGRLDLGNLTEAPTISFGDLETGGRANLTGFSGCNQFGGRVSLVRDQVEVLELVATEIGCEIAIMDIERAYFEILIGAVRYRTDIQDLIDDQSFSPPAPTLVIESGDGAKLVFNGFTL